jgi:hypothetical protein
MEKSQSALRLNTSKVANVAGVEQVRLQGYLDRDNIYLDAIADRPKDKHRTYTFLDAVRVALIGRLVAHGMTSAKEASGLVERLLGGTYGSEARAKKLRRGDLSVLENDSERNSIISSFLATDVRMFAWRDGEKWDFAWSGSGGLFGLSGADPETAAKQDTLVLIQVSQIVETIVERMGDLGFIPDDFEPITVESLAANPLYEGYSTAQLLQSAKSKTLLKKLYCILEKEKS